MQDYSIRKISNDKTMKVKTLDSCRIEIIPDVAFVEETCGEDKEIISLNIGGVLSIAVGDNFVSELETFKLPYKVNFIERCGLSKRYILLSHKRNKTCTYLLPSLSMNKKYTKPYFTGIDNYITWGYLCNCYIHDNKFLNLVYRWCSNDTFKHLEMILINHPQYVIKMDQNEFVIFQFRIPDEHLNNVDLFLKGKYSKFTDKLKQQIIHFHQFLANQRVTQTLFKKKELRIMWEKELAMSLDENVELDSKPEKLEEIWENSKLGV
jgi:hypothetical protein